MKLITAKLFTFVRRDGIIGSIELYINETGTFGYRMWNSKGYQKIEENFDDGTAAWDWYEYTIKLFKIHSFPFVGKIKSWKEVI